MLNIELMMIYVKIYYHFSSGEEHQSGTIRSLVTQLLTFWTGYEILSNKTRQDQKLKFRSFYRHKHYDTVK